MKRYLAWVGSNNTIGKENTRTGLRSTWGKLYAFTTRKERDEFCEQYNNQFNTYPKAVNKQSAKKYFAGLSTREYYEQLELLLNGYVDHI